MKISKFLIDESIKLYALTHKRTDRAIDIPDISKKAGLNRGHVWNKLYRDENMYVDTFIRIMWGMNNIKFDESKSCFTINITNDPFSVEFAKKLAGGNFKRNYDYEG